MTLTVATSLAQQPPVAAPAAPTASQSAAPPAKTEPDYPDPRTLTFSVYYLSPLSSAGPDIKGGYAAYSSNEMMTGLGRYHPSIAAEIGMPITRTGILYLDAERINGAGNQTLTKGTYLSASATSSSYIYSTGDYIASSYRLTTGRLYLDDLLFPHKFPVARLRFKSIWGIRYVGVHTIVDAPLADLAAAVPNQSEVRNDSRVFLPEFGLAMEYAVAPHALFRIEGAGFGIPHRSDLAEGSATLAVREKHVEIVGGIRMFHFKTNPYKEEYTSGTMVAAFGGLRWHW